MFNFLFLKIYCIFYEIINLIIYFFVVYSYLGNLNYVNFCYGYWMIDIRLVVILVISYEVIVVS